MTTTVTAKRFAQAVLTTSSATLYTCPSSTVAVLRDLQVCNIGGGSPTYTLYYVASGDSPANKNTIAYQKTCAAQNTDVYRFNAVMTAGDTIRGLASANTMLTVQASGVEAVGTFVHATPKRLVQYECTTASTTAYTVPASTTAILKDLTVANLTGSSHTFTIDVVPSGGSVGNASKLFYTYSVAANAVFTARLSMVMATGDTFRCLADANNSISVNLSGAEIV